MSQFLIFRDDTAAALDAILPQRLKVKTIAGRIDEKILRDIAKTQGVYVALVTWKLIEQSLDAATYNCGLVAFIVTKQIRAEDKETTAITIADQLTIALTINDMNLGSKRPQKIASTTLYSDAIDKTGIALWSVSWQQEIEIDLENTDAAAQLDGIFAEYRLTDSTEKDDKPNATDDINY